MSTTVEATPAEVPAPFAAGVAALRAAQVRPDVTVREVLAPVRIAPFAHAISVELVADGEELATGRLVLLFDPAGQPAWEGSFRLVGFLRADIDSEMASDPLLPDVCWAWLLESLEAHRASSRAAAGTVTTTASHRYGTMSGVAPVHELELRCSWSPQDAQLAEHLEAFCDLVAGLAGRPPTTDGVRVLRRRRSP